MNNKPVDPDQKIKFKIRAKRSLYIKKNTALIVCIAINKNRFKEEIKNNLLLVVTMKVNLEVK
jgi:hypothetical protein